MFVPRNAAQRTLLFAFCLLPFAFCLASPPRPEHPQPQFVRDSWLTLNGPWQFEYDDKNAGLRENWALTGRPFSRQITVPYCPESALSGIGDISFHPWVWFWRSFDLPAGWKGRRVLLHFGAVDYRAQVWVNGKMAGSHEGGHVPFTFEITPLLNIGENTLTVRAEDPPRDRYIPRGKQYWAPKSRGIFYTRTTGIWQTVWLEAVGSSYLSSVRMTPDLGRGAVEFDFRVVAPAPESEIFIEVSFQGQRKAIGLAAAEEERVSAVVMVPDPQAWSPETPNLYDVTFQLRSGDRVLDKVTSYFGLRRVAVERGMVFLNNRPTYLKMVLDQGYWPESILTPPTDEAIQYDIRLTKQMGFNGVRKHQKLEDPRYLYWADKMGLLVSSEMANAYLYDERYAAAFTREWIEAVERDYNHPSIIMWVPINESWGVPDLRNPRQQMHLKSLYSLTRSLDATRPVIDNDGWEHTDSTDLFALHDYIRTGERLYEKWKALGPNYIPNISRGPLAPGFAYNGTPFLLSEYGGIAYIPPGAQVPSDSWGYSGVEKTAEAALERYRGLTSAIFKIPAFAGYCYTQLTDVEQEVNGLLTYDRKPKFDVKVVYGINNP
jgi:beta-galactosidase/beta-glucuronidase